MASLTELSSVEKKRVARLVQQLLECRKAHESALRRWAREAAAARSDACVERGRWSLGAATQAAAAARRAALECQRAAAQFAELGRVSASLATDRSELAARSSELAARNSELGAQNSELGAQNSELAAQNSELAAQNSELVAQNSELIGETVELRAKLVKSLKLVKTYQLQLLDKGPAPRRRPEEPTTASSSSDSESDDELRRGLACRSLRVAFEGATTAAPTPEDLEAAVRARADASSGAARDDAEETRIASALVDSVLAGAQHLHAIEMGMGIGRACLAAFVAKPRPLRVVRGVELCPSRFAAADRALRRLVAASRAERADRRRLSSKCCRPARLLPRLDLAAASAGLVRVRGRGGRVLEFRMGDFFDAPATALAKTDLLWLMAPIPRPRLPDLDRLLAALPPGCRVASLPNLDRRSEFLAPRGRILDSARVYERTSSPRPPPPPPQKRARLPTMLNFEPGDLVLVKSAHSNNHGRARVLEEDADGTVSVLYLDGRVEDSVAASRIRRDADGRHRAAPRQPLKNRRPLPASDDDARPPRLASSRWVSIWDDDGAAEILVD